jgi:hypothetical protein
MNTSVIFTMQLQTQHCLTIRKRSSILMQRSASRSGRMRARTSALLSSSSKTLRKELFENKHTQQVHYYYYIIIYKLY